MGAVQHSRCGSQMQDIRAAACWLGQKITHSKQGGNVRNLGGVRGEVRFSAPGWMVRYRRGGCFSIPLLLPPAAGPLLLR